jgi:signal transduction histidine kinase
MSMVLLDNALRYGGGAEVSAAYEEGAIHIRVRDFGPGIPPDKLATVFEPFVRLETARAVVGVGLGLTIAKSLAEKNEAGLILSNHPDGGLEARLILRRGLVAVASPGDMAACA